MTITPLDIGTFLVKSQTRKDLLHLVDMAFVEEGCRVPRAVCSCEGCQCKRTKYCRHIRAVAKWIQQKLEREIKDLPY